MKYLLIAALLLATAAAQGDYAQRFDLAWRLVAERYWDQNFNGVDWQAVREAYEPEALRAGDDAAFYAVLEAMYQALGDNHTVFVPPHRVQEIRESFGDLPCLPVFMQAGETRFGTVRYELLEPGIGLIQLPDLASANVAGNLRQAVRSLIAKQAESLILDLRGNPGGRLLEMMQAAGVFTGGLLWRVVTRWMLPIPYPAIGPTETGLPLVVLIDGGVNSAAEGLAGALQAQERAVLIGETTAGNVEAVLPFCLPGGSQAWIATGVLAPLRGPTWEGRGVEPDIAVPAAEALEAALRYLHDRRAGR
ncbi:MAG: hypothetical protein KGZ60_02720 [Truepera sp.]|nr:hypothetical protein [Truepera sp.]